MYALKSVSNLRFTYPSSDRSHSKIQVVLQSKKTNHRKNIWEQEYYCTKTVFPLLCAPALI